MKKGLKNWEGTAAVIGIDFGDSGKGRIIDDLAQTAHIVARFNGGSNTGHTIQNNFGKFALHMIPSGIFNKKTICAVGRGVACDLESLIEDEFEQLKRASVNWNNLKIDELATLTMPWHKMRDGLREKYRDSKIGTTGRGVGPTYSDRVERVGLRVKDLYSKDFKKILKDEISFQNKIYSLNLSYPQILSTYESYAKTIKPFVTQTAALVQDYIKAGKNVLFEGAQGWFLDIDSGTYPFVTSSNPGVIGITRSFDLLPKHIKTVIGITKSYLTRVGSGPMPTKIEGQIRETIIKKGHEIGTTSGRTRDPGWMDLVLLKAARDANGLTDIALTKLDIFSGFKTIKLCTAYTLDGKKTEYVSGDSDTLARCKPQYEELPGWEEEISSIRDFGKLPKNAQAFIDRIEKVLDVPISFIGVGPAREEVIYV